MKPRQQMHFLLFHIVLINNLPLFSQWLTLFDLSLSNALQVKSEDVFDEWVSKLRHHRMYRQNEIAMFPRDVNHFFPGSSVTDSAPGVFESVSSRKVMIVLPATSLKEQRGTSQE